LACAPGGGRKLKKALVGTSAQPGIGSNQRSFVPQGLLGYKICLLHLFLSVYIIKISYK
jgi:hypothetical protein